MFTTPMKLNISKMFVNRTIKEIMDFGTVVDHLWQGHPMLHQDQEAGSISGCPYLVKSCEKTVIDSSRAEHIQDINVRCVKKWPGTESFSVNTSHFLTSHLKEQRAIKSKCLRQHYANNA